MCICETPNYLRAARDTMTARLRCVDPVTDGGMAAPRSYRCDMVCVDIDDIGARAYTFE